MRMKLSKIAPVLITWFCAVLLFPIYPDVAALPCKNRQTAGKRVTMWAEFH